MNTPRNSDTEGTTEIQRKPSLGGKGSTVASETNGNVVSVIVIAVIVVVIAYHFVVVIIIYYYL